MKTINKTRFMATAIFILSGVAAFADSADDAAGDFAEGLAVVETKDGKRAYINADGEILTETIFDPAKATVSSWKLREITSNPNLNPFPEYISINFSSADEGTLIMKLRRSDKVKIYPFLRAASKTVEAAPKYNHDEGEYVLQEKAVVSFSKNTITVDLEWISLHQGQIAGDVMLGGYEFVFKDDSLDFKRTNGKDEDLLVYTAVYSQDALQDWRLQKVILNPDPMIFPESVKAGFIDGNEGNLTVQFAHHNPKTYPFSRSQSIPVDSVEKHTDEWSLQEKAVVSFSGNTITVDSKQTWLQSGKLTDHTMSLKHEFVLQDDRLDFKAIKEEDAEMSFTAVYSLDE